MQQNSLHDSINIKAGNRLSRVTGLALDDARRMLHVLVLHSYSYNCNNNNLNVQITRTEQI